MSEVIVYCPNCQQKISCPAEYEGREFTCPTCGQCLMLTDITSEQSREETTANTEEDQIQQAPIVSPAKTEFTDNVLLNENEKNVNIFTSDSSSINALQEAKKDTKKEIKIPRPPHPSSVQDTLSFFAIFAYLLGVALIFTIFCSIGATDVGNKGVIICLLGATCIAMFITGILFSAAAELLEHQRQTSFYTKKLYELMWKKEHKDK